MGGFGDGAVRCGHAVHRHILLPIVFDGHEIDAGYRLDLLLDDEVIVELKSVDHLEPIHEAQLVTYLRLSHKHVGLLINFNISRLKDGILRRVL